MSGYKGGRILRIKVKDFMTYDDLEIFPKKGLNIIVGLNGSGKSSLLCAICLGLAGKPSYTGKSTQLHDFIKYGKQKAIIEIELDDPEENVLICRVIEEDKSLWFLNNVSVSQNDIITKIRRYNIDVGNLCQFLPQEKVSDFSRIDHKHRLEIMLQAIGEPALHELFDNLKKMKADICNMERDLNKMRNSKVSQEQKNSQLKVEVDKHEKKKCLEEELHTLQMQQKCIEYRNLQQIVNELKKVKRKLGSDVKKVKDELNTMEREMSTISSNCRERLVKIKEAHEQSLKISENVSKCQNRLREIHEQVESAKLHYRSRLEMKNTQAKKLADLEQHIQALHRLNEGSAAQRKTLQVQSVQNSNDYNKLRGELNALDEKLQTINLTINSTAYQNRTYKNTLVRLENEQNYQMEFLRQRFRHTYDAAVWLMQNKSTFKSEIFLPPILSVKVHRDEDRKFIENIVSLRDLRIFICTDEDDLKRLTNILCTQKKLVVNIGLAPKERISAYPTPRITPEMNQQGIEKFASDLFTAPEPVMCYLCALSRMNRIPICNETSVRFTEQILKKFNRFYTPNERFSGSQSRYGAKNFTTRKDTISAKNLIQSATNANAAELQDLQRKISEGKRIIDDLSAQSETYAKQRSVLERKQEKLREEKKKLQELDRKLANTGIQLKEKQGTYERIRSEVIDEVQEKKKVISKICSLNTTRLSEGAVMNSLGLELSSLKIQNVKDILYIKFESSKLSNLRAAEEEKRRHFTDLSRTLEAKTQEYAESRNKGVELSKILQTFEGDQIKLKNLDLPENHESNEGFLNAAVISIEELEEKIVHIEAQLALNYEDNASVLQEYQNRKLTIIEISKRISALEKKHKRLEDEMKEKKQQLLPALEYHINNINKKFSHYYKLLKCAGEISLEMGRDPDDFAEYGVQVRCKYRDNESFSVLSSDHHSGGERNVASIIFILSLQELTTVPFRCVDEINQGMDNTNERKMYEFIAADASKTDSCSQYFLLTPKLLPNLVYHKDVAIHIIFNSRFLETKLNVKQHLQIAGTN